MVRNELYGPLRYSLQAFESEECPDEALSDALAPRMRQMPTYLGESRPISHSWGAIDGYVLQYL